MSFVILFSDASFSCGKAGLACIATTDGINVIEVSTKQEDAIDVVYAELLAIRENIRLANRFCHPGEPVELISDCTIAVNLLTSATRIPQSYESLVATILADKASLESKTPVSIKWGSRNGNTKADALAVLASRRHDVTNRNGGRFKFSV